jgi:hypothetical protein
MTHGSVYILQNPALLENMFKIGRTMRTVQQRAKELSSTTGLPEKFNIRYERDVPDCIQVEKLVHQKLEKYRYRANREFFVLPLQDAISTIEEVIQDEFDEQPFTLCPGVNRLEKTLLSGGLVTLKVLSSFSDMKIG